MYFIFKENVYLVRGKVNSCIYDFNTFNLYQLDSKTVKILDKIVNSDEKSIKDANSRNLVKEFMEHNILEKKAHKQDIPITNLVSSKDKINFAWIEITTKCNLFCIHCYDSASPQETSVLNWNDYKQVLKLICESGIKRVQFIGGEPLLQKDLLKKMILAVKEYVDFIEVFTNATLITDEWAKFFADNHVRIAISVYSYSPEEHDKVTTISGSHQRTINGIKILSKYKIPYRICNVLMKDVDVGTKNTDLYTINPDKDIVRIVGRANFQLLSRDLIEKKLITEESFSFPLNPNICSRIISGHNCFGHKIYISSTGEVYPCVMERRWSYGNIHSEYEYVLEKVQGSYTFISKDTIDSCKDCEFRYTCFDCRPNSLGNPLTAKPWYCTYIPEEGRWEDVDKFIDSLIAQQNSFE